MTPSTSWKTWAIAFACLFQFSIQEEPEDPVRDFCRRWQHQTCIVDNKLYIDGGVAAYGGSFDNETVQRNTWLIYENLSSDTDSETGFPVQYANLTKPTDVPTVSGGILWPDNVNKLFYLYGGEYVDSSPNSFTLWFFDVLTSTWNRSYADGSQAEISRASFGAGIVVEDRGMAYYYGGYLSNRSVADWQGDDVMLNSLVRYDMVANRWTNATYDHTPKAEGTLLYIPASDRGMLVYFGGVEKDNEGASKFVSMDAIFLFDIAAEKWYTQTAGGDVPQARRGFCAGVTWADDQSSYNIYLYGGLAEDGDALGDVYILTLPSFEWILWYPNVTATTFQHGKAWSSCNVYGMSQMLITGGYYSNKTYSDCDAASVGGQHGLSLGQQNVEDAQWYQYLPNLTSYEVAPTVTAMVGGGPTGGAPVTEPAAGWATSDLAVYFTRTYSPQVRTPTRYIPSSTAVSVDPIIETSSKSNTINVAAIAGGTVGGTIVLISIIGIVLCCFRRRRSYLAEPSAHSTFHRPTSHHPQAPMAEKNGTCLVFPQAPDTAYLTPEGSTSRPDTAASSWQQHHSPQQHLYWSPVSTYPGHEEQSMQHANYHSAPHGQQRHPPADWRHDGRAELPGVISCELPTMRSFGNMNDHVSQWKF